MKTALIYGLILALLLAPTSAQTRPRYTLSLPRAPFIAWDTERLPSTLRPMCWNEDSGFCDTFTDTPYLITTVTDWQSETLGGIWQVGKGCYLQLFAANSEHPYLAEWIVCADESS